MKLIAHRGNVNEPNPELENTPDHIKRAYDAGYDVEIDIWCIRTQTYTGHDRPLYRVETSLFVPNRTWLHLKNSAAVKMYAVSDFHYFYHDRDAYTITSKGFLWVYKTPLVKKCICVLPEDGVSGKIEQCYGICTDYVKRYSKI